MREEGSSVKARGSCSKLLGGGSGNVTFWRGVFRPILLIGVGPLVGAGSSRFRRRMGRQRRPRSRAR